MKVEMMFTTAHEVFTWMETGCAAGVQPGLKRMNWMCEHLHHPERRLKFIHIAGTNGKGSTGAMVSSILREAGYPTGMFTSPFLSHWGERISMDGKPIPEEAFVHWASIIAQLTEERAEQGGERITQFEFWTLLALLYFARQAVPWFVVWETGLGGRLDSTNVVHPLISVITTIGRDHQEILGETIPEIAREKAGIIKSGVPVVCSVTNPDALEEIRTIAQAKKCRFYEIDQDFYSEPRDEVGTFDFIGPYQRIEKLRSPLVGQHQVENSVTALMACEVLRQFYATVIDSDCLRQGLGSTQWPGRMETVSHNPRIVLDGAHNGEGAQALKEALACYKYKRLHLLLGITQGKEVAHILSPLLPYLDTITVTQANHPRARSAQALEEAIQHWQSNVRVTRVDKAEEALEKIRQQANKEDLIVIAGSLFLVAEIRSILQ